MNNNTSEIPLILLPKTVWEQFKSKQDKILEKLENIQLKNIEDVYLTAAEFMEKTKMSRASFDEKRANNEFRVIKKGRKLYLKATEVQNYFES